MPFKPALGVREAVAGRTLGALEGGEGGNPPPFQCIPWRVGCVPFSKWWVPPSDGTPPPPGGGVGQDWAGGFEGKGYIPGAAGFVPLHFPLRWSVGEGVGGCLLS